MARAARQSSIDPCQIQIIHVWNRCVRRAFLCGHDPVTGKDFEHRRRWARERLEHLASIFAIDCLTFSIMSNHTHQILRSRPDIVDTWDDREVALRWLKISPKRDKDGAAVEPTAIQIDLLVRNACLLARIRKRLSDVSWWMRYFSHHMAVRSNREDEVTGHFWESRFGAELLLDEGSVLACMIYVDLNPVRAGMAVTPEESDYTGVKERIDDLRISLATTGSNQATITLSSSTMSTHDWERLDNECAGWLSPIEIDEAKDPTGPDAEQNGRRASRRGSLPLSLARYLELLDFVGRMIRSDKRGSIPNHFTPLLKRVGLTPKDLIYRQLTFGKPNIPNFVQPSDSDESPLNLAGSA